KADENKSEKDTTATDSLLPLPKMVYPLNAYGQDSLPVASAVLIQNATVWTLDENGILEKADVLISDGKIKSVGTNLDLSEFEENGDLQTIDGTGLHITPGIIDEHSHIAITRGVNEGTQSSTAEVRIADAVSPNDINIYRQLAGGVTTSQLLHGSANPIGGQSALIKMRWGEDMNDMLFAEAPGFIKFALGENVKQSNWGDSYNTRYPQTRMGVEQFYYDSFYRAKEYGQLKQLNEAGKKAKKKRRRKKEETEEKEAFRTDIELEALLEILNSERFITCHSYVQSEINMLMHVADSMGFTLNTFTHILEGYKVADKMKDHGASASTFSDWWAYKYEVKDAIPHNASILNRMGVTTAINSDDAEMGRRLNQEAAKGIRYGGMSEEDALKMVTLNPAKMLHIDEYVGSITPGKDADLVIWSDHPLSVYAKAMKTFVDGKIYFDRDDMELRKVRDEIERNEIANKMAKAASNGSATQKPKRKMERYYHCDTKE
ncbi:MAG: amidohydrolase, partial [Cryomorphaceae bacterium]